MAYINGNQILFSTQIAGLVNIDGQLSGTSTNPVQNKVILKTLQGLAFDIKAWIDGSYLYVDFYYFNDNGNLVQYADGQPPIEVDITSVTSGIVWLYKDTTSNWAVSLSMPNASTYSTTPLLLGYLKSKTVDGATKKYFFENNDEQIFDDLNGEKLTLLKEFTVTDTGETPLSVYNFTTDDNGNAFNLKACRVVLYVPSGQNQGGAVAFSPNTSATNSFGRFSISNIRQASTHSLFYFDLHAEKGFYVVNGYGTSATYLANTMPKTLTADTSRILSVYFQTNQTNYGFPVGTTFRIYGVQDNAN